MKSQIILALIICGFIKQSQNCPTGSATTSITTTTVSTVDSTTNTPDLTPNLECDIAQQLNETLAEFFDITFPCENETRTIGRNATVVLKKELQINLTEVCKRDDEPVAPVPPAAVPVECNSFFKTLPRIGPCVVRPEPGFLVCPNSGQICDLIPGPGRGTCQPVGTNIFAVMLECPAGVFPSSVIAPDDWACA